MGMSRAPHYGYSYRRCDTTCIAIYESISSKYVNGKLFSIAEPCWFSSISKSDIQHDESFELLKFTVCCLQKGTLRCWVQLCQNGRGLISKKSSASPRDINKRNIEIGFVILLVTTMVLSTLCVPALDNAVSVFRQKWISSSSNSLIDDGHTPVLVQLVTFGNAEISDSFDALRGQIFVLQSTFWTFPASSSWTFRSLLAQFEVTCSVRLLFCGRLFWLPSRRDCQLVSKHFLQFWMHFLHVVSSRRGSSFKKLSRDRRAPCLTMGTLQIYPTKKFLVDTICTGPLCTPRTWNGYQWQNGSNLNHR